LLAGDPRGTRQGLRLPAGDFEGLVLDRLRKFFPARTDVSNALAPLGLDAAKFEAALTRASELSRRWLAVPPSDIATGQKSTLKEFPFV
jgi:site-specific DNA recombinase